MTLDQIINSYGDDLAYLAGQNRAATADTLIDQIEDAGRALKNAGIPGWADVDTAAGYLAEAMRGSGDEQRLLLAKAAGLLSDLDVMRGEYADMA